ncbi:MAG: type II toxin-antitoxin system HicA family toxin [Armatimonadota bacterium]
MKVRELIRLVAHDGWILIRIKGSHRHYKHPIKPGLVTIAGKPGDDLPIGTLKSIFKQAGLEVDPWQNT